VLEAILKSFMPAVASFDRLRMSGFEHPPLMVSPFGGVHPESTEGLRTGPSNHLFKRRIDHEGNLSRGGNLHAGKGIYIFEFGHDLLGE